MGKKIYTADDIKVLSPEDATEYDIDISREGFESNLVGSASYAVEFARTFITNILPDSIKYMVYLNSSYDESALEEDEYVYPDDNELSKKLFSDNDSVVELLWRDGKVPEWINVTVEAEDDEYTTVKLECCGRFSSNEKYMYHAHEGKAPFHVLGPPIPSGVNVDKGDKYDLYWDKKDDGSI